MYKICVKYKVDSLFELFVNVLNIMYSVSKIK